MLPAPPLNPPPVRGTCRYAPLNRKIEDNFGCLLFFAESTGFGQRVAFRQTYLRWVMSVCELLRNYKSCVYSQK